MPRRLVRAVVPLLTLLALGACATGAHSGASGTGGAPIRVTTGFYPLTYVVTEVGGHQVEVTTLTKPGAEPHELELTPQDVAGLSAAGLVVTLGGFQPAVDTAVQQQAADRSLDVAAAAGLDLEAPAAQDGEHTDADHQGKDPHFWLDPVRYAAVGRAVADRLASLDPAHAADYQAGAGTFAARMTELDAAYRQGLASCASTTLVTSHAAFGYLAARYHLTQVPIAGLSPEQEPSARKLAEVSAIVKQTGVKTIYAETLVDRQFAETVATSTGATLAVLDPIEGITSATAGSDYREVMRSNLASLRTGMGCS